MAKQETQVAEEEQIVDNFGEGNPEEQAEALKLDDSSRADDSQQPQSVIHEQEANELPLPEEDVAEGQEQSSEIIDEEQYINFPDELLRAAGYTNDQANEYFESPDALAAAIRQYDAQMISQAQQQIQQQQPVQPRQDQPPQLPIQTSPQPITDHIQSKPATEAWELPKPEVGEDWDNDTKTLFASLDQHYKSQLQKRDEAIQQQQSQLNAIVQQQQSIEAQRYLDDVDEFVEALGDEWVDVFGRGTWRDLDPGSLAMRNRNYIEQMSNTLEDNLRSSNMYVPPRDELRVRALLATFPERRQQQIERETTQQVANRNKLMTHRPSNRVSSQSANSGLTGEQSAIKRVEEFWLNRGMTVEPDDGGEYDVI